MSKVGRFRFFICFGDVQGCAVGRNGPHCETFVCSGLPMYVRLQ